MPDTTATYRGDNQNVNFGSARQSDWFGTVSFISHDRPNHGLKMADPKFSEPSQIDVILGAELYEYLGLPVIERSGEVVFTNTAFGYVASGTVSVGTLSCSVVNTIQAPNNDLKRFQEIDEVPRKPQLSPIGTQDTRHISMKQQHASQTVVLWLICLGHIRPHPWVKLYLKQKLDCLDKKDDFGPIPSYLSSIQHSSKIFKISVIWSWFQQTKMTLIR